MSVVASWLRAGLRTPKQPSKQFGTRSRACAETPYPIWIKFCSVVAIPDIISYADFCDDRLRGLGVAGGQILSFPIGFLRGPYSECVMLVAHVPELEDSSPERGLSRPQETRPELRELQPTGGLVRQQYVHIY